MYIFLDYCGCFAEDEEISIENDKCVLNLATFPNVAGSWSLTFDLKINSLPTEPTNPPYNSWINWNVQIISGIGSLERSFLSENPEFDRFFIGLILFKDYEIDSRDSFKYDRIRGSTAVFSITVCNSQYVKYN